ncbi:MAG TPA: GHKL domain-containing protein [Candidatus Onthousia faecavium]|nr:GHKL domain-containing protein [Candidatus Onthousia faecavium]
MLIKFISVAIMNFTATLITKRVLNYKNKILSLKTLLWYIISMIPTAIFYTSDYDFTTFLTFLTLILCLKNIFDMNILVSSVITLYIMVISAFFDLLSGMIAVNFLSLKQIRTNFEIIFITNLIITALTYFCFYIPIVKKKINESLEKIQKPKNRKFIIFGLFGYIAICITFYLASKSFMPTNNYLIINTLILTFIGMIFIYMNEIIKYDKLVMQNNTLFECMQNVENYQEQQDLKIHEYKNQLSKIMDITTDQKVIDKLSEILKVDWTADNYILGQIKYLPKGELKSLIYYKLLVATKHKLNISVDISPKLISQDFNFSANTSEELSELIGIYFDNAIESALESKKKQIALEIYKVKHKLVFVITNTYKGKIKLNNVTKKGFSTKGNSHGKGLYFANKIIKNSNSFISDTKVIDDYFIQKLEIKKEC